MRYALKEARLQNPVLTNRNGIQRHICSGKQAHLCKAQRTQKGQLCRFRRHWKKGKALTGGGLGIDSLSMSQEVSRGHSSYGKRAGIDSRMAHRSSEGLNVKRS
ncbi:MAG: hypothetical protein WC974_09515 [Thermoplasmata archaeon]